MKAAAILEDFRRAIDMLNVTTDPQLFRILCVAASSLSRSIGYALQNDEDPTVATASDKLFRQWKSDENCIFNTFIHRYRAHAFHDAELDLEFDATFVCLDRDTGEAIIVDNDLIYVPFSDFGFGDLDIRDLFEESYDWWVEQFRLLGLCP